MCILKELKHFESLIIILFMVCLGIWTYNRAVKSRKYYKCSECGESFRVEFMEASHCKTCGAKVSQSEDSNITDKA